jgi:hypothetical protein
MAMASIRPGGLIVMTRFSPGFKRLMINDVATLVALDKLLFVLESIRRFDFHEMKA